MSREWTVTLTLVSAAVLLWAGSPGRVRPAAPPGPLPAAQPAPPGAAPKGPRLVVFDADKSVSQGDLRMLIGHVRFQEGDTTLIADQVTYNEVAKTGEAVQVPGIKGGSVGRPHAQDALHTLTADRLTFDMSPKEVGKKVVSAVGNAVLVAKPKPIAPGPKAKPAPGAAASPTPEISPATPAAADPSASEATLGAKPGSGASEKKQDRLERRLKEETILTADRMDYYYRTKRAVAEGGLKVTQGKRWLTGDQAIYYDRYDTVVVNGNVKGEDEKGRTFNADNLKIILTGDTETIEANRFNGTFQLDEEEEAPPEETPDEKPPVFDGSPPAAPLPAPSVIPAPGGIVAPAPPP